jgi:hypothetical protein
MEGMKRTDKALYQAKQSGKSKVAGRCQLLASIDWGG